MTVNHNLIPAGEIMNWVALDREQHSQHSLKVMVSDHGRPRLNATATVHVSVTDVNDNAPEFAMSYDTFVCENVKAGQVRRHPPPKDSTTSCCNSRRLVIVDLFCGEWVNPIIDSAWQ